MTSSQPAALATIATSPHPLTQSVRMHLPPSHQVCDCFEISGRAKLFHVEREDVISGTVQSITLGLMLLPGGTIVTQKVVDGS